MSSQLSTSELDVCSAAHSSQLSSMIHEILPVGPLQCNCSIIGDDTSREAMVIDPATILQTFSPSFRSTNSRLNRS